MRRACNVELYRIRPVDRGPRTPALRPQSELPQSAFVADRIGGFDDEFRADGARIGQPLADLEWTGPRDFVQRAKRRAVRAFGD